MLPPPLESEGDGIVAVSVSGESRNLGFWSGKSSVDAILFDRVGWRAVDLRAFSFIRLGSGYHPEDIGPGIAGVPPEEQDFEVVRPSEREWLLRNIRIHDVSVPPLALHTTRPP